MAFKSIDEVESMPHKILMTYHDSQAFRADLTARGFTIASQGVRAPCCSSLRRCGGRPMPSGGEALQSTFPIKRSKDYEGGNERTRKGEIEVEEEVRATKALGYMINEWKKFLNGGNFRNLCWLRDERRPT